MCVKQQDMRWYRVKMQVVGTASVTVLMDENSSDEEVIEAATDILSLECIDDFNTVKGSEKIESLQWKNILKREEQ